MPPSAFLQATLCISNKESAMAAQQLQSSTTRKISSKPSRLRSPLQLQSPSDGYWML